jgi:N-dimethylarginine dimethylaminohydrolase
MYHITIKPDTFQITPELVNQNPYINLDTSINKKAAINQHNEITREIKRTKTYGITKKGDIPDIVFAANLGLSLPRLPEAVVITSWMKYRQRRNELDYIEEILDDSGIKHVQFPGSADAPFEGQAEAKWFENGELLICGYGFRATKESIRILRKLLTQIYENYGIKPPRVAAFEIQSPKYFHLDAAMLEFGQTECVIHKGAFDANDLHRLKAELGERNVHLIDTADSFCLNSIIEDDRLITHVLTDQKVRSRLESITGKMVTELDASEFEKSGGGVRCLIFDVFDPRMIKRKRSQQNLHSPKKQ